jgi:hypothetical protein
LLRLQLAVARLREDLCPDTAESKASGCVSVDTSRLQHSRCGGGRIRVFLSQLFEAAAVVWDAEKEDSL